MTERPQLTQNSYVVLGTLHIGARSGYEVRQWIERSASFFWAISSPQVYPELKRLEAAGFIKGRDDPQGARDRRVYTVTAPGLRALKQWLRSPGRLAFSLRDVALLKLFFADVLEPSEAIEHLQSMRARALESLEEVRAEIHPRAVRQEDRTGNRFPTITAQYALDYHAWVAGWCEAQEAALKQASRKRR